MKKLLLMLLLSTGVYAQDLIYLNGFENTGLVSGTVTGLVSTGLLLEVSSSPSNQILSVGANGNFVFSLQVTVGDSWNVSMLGLPNNPTQQSCIISNQSGVMQVGGVNNLTIVCNNNSWKWDEMNWDEGGWQ